MVGKVQRGLSRAAWAAFRRSKRIRKPYAEIHRFQTLRPERQRDEVFQLLRASLHFFSKQPFALPEWAQVARIDNSDEFWRAWLELPILSKADLRSKYSPEVLQSAGLRGRMLSSSGSTGEPTSFIHDPGMRAYISAANYYCQLRRGWKPGVPIVGIWGSPRDLGQRQRPLAQLASWIRGLHLIGAYDLGPHTLEQLVSLTARMPRFAIYGFPSMLEYLSRLLLERGDNRFYGRVQVAWTGGETLTEEQCRLFKRAFGVALLNHYGGRELSAIASQWSESSPLEVIRRNVMVEILDENNRPARPGTPGRIVCTSLTSRATPFIRYEIGDVGASPDSDAPFGVAKVANVLGRTTETIRLATGTTIHGIFWAGMVREFPEVLSYQVRWNPSFVRLLLVAPGIARDRREKFEGLIRARANGTPCVFEYVTEIPRTKEGKLLRVVREES